MLNSALWYAVNVYSGFEKKVAENIREQAEKKGLSDQIEQVLVPTEDVIEVKKGAKVVTERKFIPGYILVKMVMTDDAWHLVKNTPKVSGFLGARGKPSPVSPAEIDRILAQVQEGVDRPKSVSAYEVGEQVRVCDGPFSTFMGVVESVDADKSRLRVSVSIFGRSTPVDLEYTQVEKV